MQGEARLQMQGGKTMSTYREVVHMVLDELKMVSDDNYYTPTM